MRESITQKHDFGCAVACLAFVANITYAEALKVLGSYKAKSEGYICKDLVNGLDNLGFSYEYKYIKPRLRKSIYRDGAIVFIKRYKKYPYGHYLARYNGKWMDPWINLVSDKNVTKALSGFRKRLPGRPIYMITKMK